MLKSNKNRVSLKGNQKTGGSATPGPGLGTGVPQSVNVRKVKVPGNFKTSPNSSTRAKAQTNSK